MMRKIWALTKARNLEFFRDIEALSWNLIVPILLVVGIALAFNGGQKQLFKIALIQEHDGHFEHILDLDAIQVIHTQQPQAALKRLEQHQYDLVLKRESAQKWQYWYNPLSDKSQFLDKLIQKIDTSHHYTPVELNGEKIRYVDWVFPGILAINIMYSALYGIGYIIVRYRKNGYLKRLQATPLTTVEFLMSQVLSRLMITIVMTSFIFTCCYLLLSPTMAGSFLLLLLLFIIGMVCMIALGLLLCSRVASEELSRGLIELAAWPMLLISGAWFSLDQAHVSIQWFSQILPLTHLIHAARDIMLYGATFQEVQFEFIILGGMSLVFLLAGVINFKWYKTK